MADKFLYYVKPEIPKQKWEYSTVAIIAESESDALLKSSSYGDNPKIISGPYQLSKDW